MGRRSTLCSAVERKPTLSGRLIFKFINSNQFFYSGEIWSSDRQCPCFWNSPHKANSQQCISRHQVVCWKKINNFNFLWFIAVAYYYCSDALYSYNAGKLAHIKELEQVSSSLLPSLSKIQVERVITVSLFLIRSIFNSWKPTFFQKRAARLASN